MRAEWFALLWREDVKLASDAEESAISLGCVEMITHFRTMRLNNLSRFSDAAE
jgi:hypothetical protein